MASDRNYSKGKSAKKMADGGSVKDKVLGLFGIKPKPEGYKSALEEKREAEAAREASAPKLKTQLGGMNLGAIKRREKEAGLE